jgi:hypothetical protein
MAERLLTPEEVGRRLRLPAAAVTRGDLRPRLPRLDKGRSVYGDRSFQQAPELLAGGTMLTPLPALFALPSGEVKANCGNDGHEAHEHE